MKKLFYIFSTMLLLSVACKNDDPEPEAKRGTIYDTTKVIDRYIDSIFHHFYDTTKVIDRYTDSIFHHFYDTLSVYDTVRVPILCDHSYVVYVLNNGTDEKDSLYIKNGATITLKSDVIRSGYDLVKWSTSPNGGGNDYQVGDDYYVNDDITLYAIWQSRDGLRSNEVYDFLAKQEAGSTVDIKIIDIYPDFNAIETALKKFWKVKVNMDLEGATEVRNFYYFNGATNLVSIILPCNLETLGSISSYYTMETYGRFIDGAFEGCTNLTKIGIPQSLSVLAINDCSNLNTISIPDNIKQLSIRDCPKITNVQIPDGVEKIDLVNIRIKTLSIPNSVKMVGYIMDIPDITEITIPDNAEMPSMCFSGCTNLKTINHHLKDCYGFSFKDCQSLTSITIPEIREDAHWLSWSFGGCSSLTSVNFSGGLTVLGYASFEKCISLTSFTIPESVTQIYGNAFSQCSSLKSLTIKANTPPTLIDESWIGYSGTIYVPSSAVNAYKTADIWKDHADQIVGY